MNYKELKHIHFIGIGGIGISYVAHFFLEQGAEVTGSDLQQSVVTDQLAAKGAQVFKGHSAENLSQDIELVVYNDAIPDDNPELVEAKRLGLSVKTNFQVVGELSKNYKTIVVAGNKGKTTTTAMISSILESAGCDPTAMVGSIVNDWGCNFRKGNSDLLVVEGDEFKEHFLEIDADMAVITNLAPDHLDYYGDMDNLMKAFQTFIDKLPNDGLLVINQDDEYTKQLRLPNCKVITFGMKTTGDIFGRNRKAVKGKQIVEVSSFGTELGEWHLPFPGRFNVYNALAATAVCLELGVKPEQIASGLSFFKGTWRRFQILGPYEMATVISDYAHHPLAVHGTIEAAKDFYEGRRIVAIFQGHTLHRTKALFDDFVASFDDADMVIIPDIFFVPGRETIDPKEMNAQMLVDAIKRRDEQHNRQREVVVCGDLASTKQCIDKIVQRDDVLLFMGAGPIYQLAEELV